MGRPALRTVPIGPSGHPVRGPTLGPMKPLAEEHETGKRWGAQLATLERPPRAAPDSDVRERALDHAARRLGAKYPATSIERIRERLAAEAASLTKEAKLKTFVPVLAAKRVEAELARE